jgi:hypothetical protein
MKTNAQSIDKDIDKITRNYKLHRSSLKLMLILGLALLLAVGVLTVLHTRAQAPAPHEEATGPQAAPLGSGFTYQGRLIQNGTPVDGITCTFTFELYDVASGGSPLGSDGGNAEVSDGYFSVALDFGNGDFQGDARWLEASVQCPGDSAPVPLSDQRVALRAAPYALYALGAPWAGLTDIPSDLTDGDDDTLGGLTCSDGQVARWDGDAWVCDADDVGNAGDTISPRQIATLRWYEAISTSNPYALVVGDSPRMAAFDGDYIWVTNANDNSVTKIRASDGSIINTHSIGASCGPESIAFDGLYLWIGCWQDQVIKIQASDGSVIQTLNFPSGSQPLTVAFDGTYTWAARRGDGQITRMLAHNPTVSDTFTVGQEPAGLAFDGQYMWVTNHVDGTVTRLLSTNPATKDTFNAGTGPNGIAFDGTYMWITNRIITGSVIALRAADGQQVYTATVGSIPTGIAFDGGHLWVTNMGDSTLTKIDSRDGSVVDAYPTGVSPQGVAFDGSHIWVVNSGSNTVSKH